MTGLSVRSFAFAALILFVLSLPNGFAQAGVIKASPGDKVKIKVTCTNTGTTTESITLVYNPNTDISSRSNNLAWDVMINENQNHQSVPVGGRMTVDVSMTVPPRFPTEMGNYYFTFQCSADGPWRVYATATFVVNVVPPVTCVIATATYGSELAPEVQLLRNFRDRDVVRTFAGSQFMKSFNSFYYSFSPNVARVISTSNGLKTVMRYVLYPLIGILWASQKIYGALGFNPEGAVVVAGLFAASIIGLVYALPFTSCASLLARRVTGRRLTRRHPAMLMAVLSVALGLTAVSELTGLALLMQSSTSLVVLAAVALPGIAFSAWTIGTWNHRRVEL